MIGVSRLRNSELNYASRIEAGIPRRIEAPKRTIRQEALAR